LTNKYGISQRQFLDFHWSSGNSSRKSGDTLWIQFIRGPIWPLLLVSAILPAGLFWWRRRWPREQRRIAARVTLILYSLLIAIAVILLILAVINTDFLGPGEKPLSGRSSHPASRPTADANGIVLKVMTYNICMGGAYKGTWRFEKSELVTERIRRIGKLIREYNPDIVFLQEVVMESGPGSVNQTPILAETAGMHAWAFGEDVNQGLPFYRFISGNAILSKWPLEVLTNQSMVVSRSFFQVGMWTNRTLWCKTQLLNQEVLLASIHLTTTNRSFSPGQKPMQMQQVLDFTGGRPAILAGDFNVRPYEAVIKQAVDNGRFSAKLDGPYTASSYNPRAKIDYIFAPAGWKLIGHEVIQTDLSDHMPILSTYRIDLVADPNSEVIAH
jgi:endonuclease/exonuclease/phosphatase family metal-dependent hydrolase